jgi:hypothetical protein
MVQQVQRPSLVAPGFEGTRVVPNNIYFGNLNKIVPGLEETVAYHLDAPMGECKVEGRDFGLLVRKRNSLFNTHGDNLVSIDFKCLDFSWPSTGQGTKPNTKYVYSELFEVLNPGASTLMFGHKGEVWEWAEVAYGAVDFVETTEKGTTKARYVSNDDVMLFAAVFPSLKKGILPSGFYHRLENPSTTELALLHIVTIAEKSLGYKNGKFLEFGFNRPKR